MPNICIHVWFTQKRWNVCANSTLLFEFILFLILHAYISLCLFINQLRAAARKPLVVTYIRLRPTQTKTQKRTIDKHYIWQCLLCFRMVFSLPRANLSITNTHPFSAFHLQANTRHSRCGQRWPTRHGATSIYRGTERKNLIRPRARGQAGLWGHQRQGKLCVSDWRMVAEGDTHSQPTKKRAKQIIF